MERVHYRRVKPSGYTMRTQESGGGLKEKLITQAIVCALILAFTLSVRVFENPLAVGIQNNLGQIFEGHTTAEALLTDIQRVSRTWLESPTENTASMEDESKSPVPELSVFPEP